MGGQDKVGTNAHLRFFQFAYSHMSFLVFINNHIEFWLYMQPLESILMAILINHLDQNLNCFYVMLINPTL